MRSRWVEYPWSLLVIRLPGLLLEQYSLEDMSPKDGGVGILLGLNPNVSLLRESPVSWQQRSSLQVFTSINCETVKTPALRVVHVVH